VSDDEVITTVDHHSGTLLDDWRTVAPPGVGAAAGHSCGDPEGSDPAAMLGLVIVLVANTAVVAAFVAVLVWILA
jgi:hypothetical protein